MTMGYRLISMSGMIFKHLSPNILWLQNRTRERERERGGEKETESFKTKAGRIKVNVCACVCVWSRTVNTNAV